MSQESRYPIVEVQMDAWTKKVNSTSMFTIPSEDEALPFLKELDEMLTRLLTMPLQETIHQKWIEYFFVNVFPVVCHKIIRSRYFKSKEVLRLANSILQNSIFLVNKYLDIGIKYPKFLQLLPTVFCTDEYYFKSNDQLSYYHFPYSYFPSKQAIGHTLHVGDLVDIIKIDSLFDKLTWSQGKVLQIFPNDVEVAYLYDWHEAKTTIRKDSPQLAKYQTKSVKNMEWRMGLKAKDVIDCEEMYGNWYNATVIEIIEGENNKKKAKVLFRVYDEKGDRVDENQKRFFGIVEDEPIQIDVTSPKIAPFCSVAKKFCYQLTKSFESIDDLNDYEYTEVNQTRVYAIPRKKYLSSLLFHTINGFGQAGGFERILSSLEQSINYDMFCCLSKCLSGISPLLHRQFVHKIIPRLKGLIERYIFEDCDKISKQFNKQKSEMMFMGLRALQKRAYSNQIVYKFENEIKMRLVESCLEDKLTQKLQGLNELKDIVKNGAYVPQKNKEIKNWIKENNIFEKIYIVDSHAQLIKKSQDFFKYLISESILQVTDLQRLYKIAQKSDYETRISLYKLFQEVAYIFRKNHVEFLIDMILESELKFIRKQDIDLLHQLSRFSNYFPLKKVIGFFESIILSQSPGSVNKVSEVNDYAIKKYSDIVVKNLEMKPKRRVIIKSFLQKMATHDISQITKVLKAIFEGIAIGEWGKRDLFDILHDEDINQVCIVALRNTKHRNAENFNYILAQILAFLLNINKLSYKIKMKVMSLAAIWEIVTGNQENQRYYFKWINELLDVCDQGFDCQPMEVFQNLFRSIFTADRIKEMEGLQLEVAKNFFIQINRKNKILSVTSCFRNNMHDKQYKRKVEMRQLKLIDLLIQMIFLIQKEEIAQKIFVFFVELYNSRENSQKEIDSFLQELLNDMKSYYKQESYTEINKIIKLLEVVINDSEKKYDANIDSLLRKKNKHEKVKFMVINEIYYSSQNVKKSDVFLQMNTTVMDLRKKLAKEFDCTWQEIRISSNREIPEHQNSKTLHELHLNPNIPLTVTKRIIYITEEEEQIMIGNQLNPKAVRCFKKIFQRYSTNGLMDKSQCNSFTGICLGSSSSKRHYSEKISSLYSQYDDDEDGYLTFENFLNFYKAAAEERAMTVWSNLRSFGVRGNFRFKDEDDQRDGKILKFPRMTLSQSKQFYQILFSLLKIKQCASLAYQLLERLPIYDKMLERILKINSQKDIEEQINCSEQYQLYYKLAIIEYLVSSDDFQSKGEQQFHCKFIKNHGYEAMHNLSVKIDLTFLKIHTLKTPTAQTQNNFYLEENKIDINQYILLLTLSLVRNFWYDYFRSKEKVVHLQQSISLLSSEEEVSDKLQSVITNDTFHKADRKVQRNFINNIQDYCLENKQIEIICCDILKRMEELWKIYNAKSKQLSETNNPDTQQKILSTLYSLEELISKTLQIADILFLNRQYLAKTLINQLSNLLELKTCKKLQTQIYTLIFCQCFYADRQTSSLSIQAIYIRQLFKVLAKGNVGTTDFFLVLALLVSLYGITSGEEDDGEQDKMKEILFENILNSNNQLTIEGCAQLLCNFKVTNINFSQFEYLWDNRLFNSKSLVTREQTKNILYQLILKICDHNPGLINRIIHKVKSTIENQSAKIKITYCNEYKERSATKYAGLKNLGNICYMNSMLQQIFMNKIFRFLLLRINDHQQHTHTQVFDEKEENMRRVDDNLLHQTQRIFSYLDLSTRVDFSPKDFCVAYKPFGQPVNVMIQQDVQEFVSMFFDRLQNFIKPTPFRNIIQDFYSGKTVNLFKCHNCHQSKKVEENFHCLALQIKNAKNLQQSFSRFTTGEQINDFRCDFCDKKVDVEKKTVVSKAPKVLLIHLQRIIFNLDTFINEKLSTKHSFPHNFNLYPYTLQCIQNENINTQQPRSDKQQSYEQSEPDSHPEKQTIKANDKIQEKLYEYQLTGIICHSGHAEAGHYISYIKTSQNKWVEFNDSIVAYFNPSNIESECFGGTFESASIYDEDYDWDKMQTCKCAYMVIYQRKNIQDQERLLNLVFDHKYGKMDKDDFLKRYDLEEVVKNLNQQLQQQKSTKVKINNKDQEDQNRDEKDQDRDRKYEKRDQEKVYLDKTQNDDSHFQQETQEEDAKELLDAKQLQIKRHQSQDNIEIHNAPKQPTTNQQSSIIKIDTKAISPYRPPQLVAQVQQDNHIHFLQKCLSSSNFSKFFAELISKPNSIQRELLPVCQKLTFGFWLKSPSFKQLLKMLAVMIKGYPQGFETVIIQNKSIASLLIEYSDGDVRTNMAEFLSKAISEVIESKSSMNLIDENEPIAKFLDYLLSLLPSTVTKCWTKFSEYFEFWYQLSTNPKAAEYMLHREIIKHFMDYFLDNKSPLKIYAKNKQNQIGSSYAAPNFSFLLKCISSLIQHKISNQRNIMMQNFQQPQKNPVKFHSMISLSHDQQILLISCEALEKLITDNYEFIAAQLVKEICPQNLYASERVAYVLMKGISKLEYQSIQAYLQVLHDYILIQDEYQELRIKWVLGKQTLAVSSYVKKIIAINSYTIDERVYNFDSSLNIESGGSLLDHTFVYHRKMENYSMLCLRQILRLCEQSKTIRDYIFNLHSPTLTNCKYVDFFKDFINRASGYYGYFTSGFNKEELSKELKILYSKVISIVEAETQCQDKSLKAPDAQKNQQDRECQNNKKIQSNNPEGNLSEQNKEDNSFEQNKEGDSSEENREKEDNSSEQNKEGDSSEENREKEDNSSKQKNENQQNIESKQMNKQSDDQSQQSEKLDKEKRLQSGPSQQYQEQITNLIDQEANYDQPIIVEDNYEIDDEDNYSFKRQQNNSDDSWDNQPINEQKNVFDQVRRRNRSGRRKKEYEINVIYPEDQEYKKGQGFESISFESEEQLPLMSKNISDQSNDPPTKKKYIEKEFKQTYHPIIFEYLPIKEIIPSKNEGDENILRSVRVTYHESVVTFGLTKPTGTSNKSIQMGLHGNKIFDRLYPQVMQNTKKQTFSGFYIKNDSRQFIRIETDDGCSYCKGLEGIWVWCKQIRKIWYSEKCIDLPKWSLFEGESGGNKNMH